MENGINFTSDKIGQWRQMMISAYSKPEVRQNIRQSDEWRRQMEIEVIKHVSTCAVEQVQKMRKNLENIEVNKIKYLVNNEFYNANVVNEILCFTNALIYLQPETSEIIGINEKIRQWFHNLRKIGEESIYGDVLISDLGHNQTQKPQNNASDLFILKIPKIESADILHEYFIGIFGTNLLRIYLPNFVYVFGGFQCSPPVIDDKDNRVITWCNNLKVNIDYVIYENIVPSVSFQSYVENCSFNEFLDKYMQVLYSLKKANELIDFTHYDLHAGNVLIRSIQHPKFYIPYQTERGITEYLYTDGIATLIDYGNSHIALNNQHYGSAQLMYVGIMPDRSFPMYDAYKLLMTSMEIMLQYNNIECLRKTEILFRFFNKTDPIDTAILTQKQYYYSFPYTQETMNITYDHLLRYIRNNVVINFLVLTPENAPVISCSNPLSTEICRNRSDIENFIGVRSSEVIEGEREEMMRGYEFVDRVRILKSENKIDESNLISSQYPYREEIARLYDEYLDKLNNVEEEIAEFRRTMVNPRIKGLMIDDIFTSMILAKYRNYIYWLSDIIDIIEEMKSILDLIMEIIKIYNVMYDAVNIIIKEYDRLDGIINNNISQYIGMIQEDYDYLNILVDTDPAINNILKKYPIYRWYLTGVWRFLAATQEYK